MPRGRTKHTDIPDSRFAEVLKHYRGDLTEACRLAGFKGPTSAASRILANPDKKAQIDKQHERFLTRLAQRAADACPLTKDYIYKRLYDIAEAGPDVGGRFGSQIEAMKLGAQMLGYLSPKEGEIKQGIVQRSDGAIEVYQSKWIKSHEHTGDKSLSGQSLVAEDPSPKSSA